MTISVVTFLVKKASKTGKIRVCLGLKKKGYSQGKWNSFGGKVEPGEPIFKAAAREIFEETGAKVSLSDLEKFGELKYYEPDGNWLVHVFVCQRWQGKIQESDEMLPRWFDLAALPVKEMWENDALWIPKIIGRRQKFKGTIWHDKNDKVVKHELHPVKNF